MLLTVAAGLVRSFIGFRGGIWADEGSFLLVVDSPTWGSMLSFLRLHESHPPLFYALMRGWRSIAGDNDTVSMVLPVVLSVILVPLIYAVGCRVFSERVGVLAALFALISGPLIEYPLQLRPYGLLQILTLTSCYALILSLQKASGRTWGAYIFTTVALIYTHNWAFLVVVAQSVSLLVIANAETRKGANARLRQFGCAIGVIAIVYAPWVRTLLYQLQHAGHGALISDGLAHSLERIALEIPLAFYMLFFSDLTDRGTAMTAAMIAAVIVVTVVRGIYTRRTQTVKATSETVEVAAQQIGWRVLVIVPLVAAGSAVALSPFSNLFFARCFAIVSPLCLIVMAALIEGTSRSFRRSRYARDSALLAGTIFVVVSLFGLEYLYRVPRSNAREVAFRVARHVQPNDMVVVTPEWYSGEFHHYFKSNVEQIDFPYDGIAGRIDFSGVATRGLDPAPLLKLSRRIQQARRQSRRIWLISVRPYLRQLSDQDTTEIIRNRKWWMFSTLQLHKIRRELRTEYGDPDTTYFLGGDRPRYDELLPFLYQPSGASPPASPRHSSK